MKGLPESYATASAHHDDVGQALFRWPFKYRFARHGKAGMWVSGAVAIPPPHVDDMAFIRTMQHRGDQSRAGHFYIRPGNQIQAAICLAPGFSYGLGSLNTNPRRRGPGGPALQPGPGASDLGAPVVVGVASGGTCRRRLPQQPATRSCSSTIRPACLRKFAAHLDGLRQLNEMNYRIVGDPETHTRIEQYELAFRMQASVPDLTTSRASRRLRFASTARKPATRARSPTPC